jgi:hypothetical protein
MIEHTTQTFADQHSHANPNALDRCRPLSSIIAEVEAIRGAKWDTTLHASELILDDQLRLPDGIGLTEDAVKGLSRLTGLPSTVSTWCAERGYTSHLACFVNDALKGIADEDARTKRPPTRFFSRFRKSDGGDTVCRALFSGSYGLLDNADALAMITRALEAADATEMLARRFYHDGDNLTVSLLLPDSVSLPDSDYGVGLEFSNSEVDGPFSIYGLVYRSQCANGMLYGVREGALYSRRHIGRIDMDEVTLGVKLAVIDALAQGRKSIDAHAAAWKVRVRDPKRLIAHLGKSCRLSRDQTTAWMKGYNSTIEEPHSPEGTLGAVLNGLTFAAKGAAIWERRAMECEAGRLLTPSIGLAFGDLERRWAGLEERAREIKDEEVERIAAL